MPPTKSLLDLFRAIGAGDVRAAHAAAGAVCTWEEKLGNRTSARNLRGALATGAKGSTQEIQSMPAVAGMLTLLEKQASLSDVELASPTRKRLDELAREWKLRSELTRQGIPPRCKLLFDGPPGCGKSLTAQALGRALEIPVYLVRFDALIGAYLGQTALHLRQVFRFAEQRRCVLLIDEIDAIAKRRGSSLDVGELDRVVISLLQELEHSKPQGLVIATTNLPSRLDDALWRRFDMTISFPRPSVADRYRFAAKVARDLNFRLPHHARSKLRKATNYAEIRAIVLDWARASILAKGDI